MRAHCRKMCIRDRMSLIYEGRFYAFPPVTELPEAGVTVIRPMMYVPERGVAHFVADQGIRVVKNTCPVDGSTKRAYAKQLMEQINRETPGAKDRIMHAIAVSYTHLAKAALRKHRLSFMVRRLIRRQVFVRAQDSVRQLCVMRVSDLKLTVHIRTETLWISVYLTAGIWNFALEAVKWRFRIFKSCLLYTSRCV